MKKPNSIKAFRKLNADPIDRSSPIPLYYQLKEYLKARIVSAKMKPGDRIPSERDLIKKHNLSYATVTRALRELVIEGLLIREQGRGSFVSFIKVWMRPSEHK